MMTIVSLLALIVNIVAFIYIIRTARKKKRILTKKKSLQISNTIRMQLQELRLNKKQGRPAKLSSTFAGRIYLLFPVPLNFSFPIHIFRS